MHYVHLETRTHQINVQHDVIYLYIFFFTLAWVCFSRKKYIYIFYSIENSSTRSIFIRSNRRKWTKSNKNLAIHLNQSEPPCHNKERTTVACTLSRYTSVCSRKYELYYSHCITSAPELRIRFECCVEWITLWEFISK